MTFPKINLSKPLVEGAKFLLREAFFGAVSAIIAVLINHFKEIPATEVTIVLTTILSYVDKVVYETWKANKKEGLRGIFPL
jgi:hypothetical protein